MLVINRSLNESLRINDKIEVKVLDIRGGSVLVRLEAPVYVKMLN